jgi:stage II sporulation protein AA (anti-sigma F factor antagonist)
MRIMFRSADHHRGEYDRRDLASPAPARHSQAGAAATNSRRALLVGECLDAGGMLRLTLLGDLDVAGAEALNARLAELKTAGRPVRLDLSRLAFIDSSGIQALIVTLTDARSTGWQLEVAPEVSPTVRRAAEITGIARILWPADLDPNPSNAPSAL